MASARSCRCASQLRGYLAASILPSGPESLVTVTGYGDPARLDRSTIAGIDHHLVKPVDPVRLQCLLETWYSQHLV